VISLIEAPGFQALITRFTPEIREPALHARERTVSGSKPMD